MKLLIVSNRGSALAQVLAGSFPACHQADANALCGLDLDAYDAFALLGGTEADPLILAAPERAALDAQMQKGKRVFAEFCFGIGQMCALRVESTRFDRPVLLAPQAGIAETLSLGTILDEQSNTRMVISKTTSHSRPILQYIHKPEGLYAVEDATAIDVDTTRYALWLETPNLLVCSFRMAHFGAAKFAPRHAWGTLFADIIAWLGGKCPSPVLHAVFEKGYTMGHKKPAAKAVQAAVDWFSAADQLVLRDGIPYAVKEGMKADVLADGTHSPAPNQRLDCTGEASLMYYLHGLYTGDVASIKTADGLQRFALDMQVTADCPHRGMLRGSLTSWWNTSYQDDAARGFLLPVFWRSLFSGETEILPQARLALEYLLSSTGTDGMRVAAIDFNDVHAPNITAYGMHCQNGKWIWGGGTSGPMTLHTLHEMPAGTPSAHYNAFYMAALLLGHHLLGDIRYLETAVRGLGTLIAHYPNTAREHSETQELCRLIMPLALLYWQTGEEQHRQWLYRVAEDLQHMRHPSGGYREWDTGYTSICHNSKASESSAFAQNGDPVCDMLYAINWLPFGYKVAHLVTGDVYFHTLWEDITSFFTQAQIHSRNAVIHGAWPRAVDMDTLEIYGIPNDTSWSPWTIESGWTVAEITSGMLLGLLDDRLRPCFDQIV